MKAKYESQMQKYMKLKVGKYKHKIRVWKHLLFCNVSTINFDYYTNENKTDYYLKWPYIPDHSYRILIIGDSGSGDTNALFNLIVKQPDIEKNIFLCKRSV